MDENKTETLQVVSFVLERDIGQKEDYAVPIEQVKEIRTLEDITQVPKAKSHVKGVMNLRGLIIPIIDVKAKLGFPPTQESSKDSQRILVAEVEGSMYGLLVDDVDQVMRLSPNDIDPAPPGAFDGVKYIKGIAKTNDKLIVFLDVVPLIQDSEEEIQSVTNLPQNANTPDSEANSDTQVSESTPTEDVSDDIPDELAQVLEEENISA